MRVGEGVIVGVMVGCGDRVILGVIDGVTVGVTDGDGIGSIKFNVEIKLSRFVISSSVNLDITLPDSYKHWNTLVNTCGAVFSFTFTKHSFVKMKLIRSFSSFVKGTISPDDTSFVSGFKVPVNL